jgi:hypothetical protein
LVAIIPAGADVTQADESVPRFPRPLEAAIERFRAWNRDNLKTEGEKDKVVTPLYHYTDARGLRGIFESQQIWFTDYRHLNDPSELLHGIQSAQDVARRAKSGADTRAQLFLDCFVDMFRRENFDKALEFYVASFSHVRNDLGQWRAYADNGRGFAIGFAARLFETVENLPTEKPPEFVGQVKYTLEDVNALYTAPILEAAQLFLSEAVVNTELIKDQTIGIPFMQEMVRELITTLIWRSLTTKHPAYQNEQEVRLVILGTSARLLPHVKTRLRGSEIVPYIPQPWPARGSGNVVEIIVGPAAPPDTERTLQKFLSTLSIDFDNIRRSDIPYRVL